MGYLLDLALRANRTGDGAEASAPPAAGAALRAAAAAPLVASAPTASGPAAPVPAAPATGDAPAPARRGSDLDRALARSELRRLIRALAEHEPEHWTPADVDEAIREGERDLDAALETWRALAKQYGIAAAPDARAEDRRRRVLAMLAERPGVRYALVSDPDNPAYPELVVLAVGLRKEDGATYTFEMLVPHDRYDPFLMMELVERHGGYVH